MSKLMAGSRSKSYDALQRTLDRIAALVEPTAAEGEAETRARLMRGHSLAAFRLLNGEHKGVLLEFLYTAGLLGGFADDGGPRRAIIALSGADLRGAILPHRNLGRINLVAAILNEADCRGCYLAGANLGGADLIDVNLAGADLTAANLALADLTGANLAGARLIEASVTPEQLAHAADVSEEVTNIIIS